MRHVGYLIAGRMRVRTDDGTVREIGPGETYVIEPGHDAVVIGREPMAAIEFSTVAAEEFARTA